MTAQLIDGNATAKAMRESIKERVDARLEQGKRAPGLAVEQPVQGAVELARRAIS